MERDALRNTRAGFIVTGAKNSRYNTKHWLRYLSKVISEEKSMLSDKEIAEIIDSGELTMYQIVTLRHAMTPGTATNEFVNKMNRRASTPMVDAIKKKYGNIKR